MSHEPRLRQSLEQWNGLQQKYRLEKARTEPMVSMEIKESFVEFTLRYVVEYKQRRTTKTALFSAILQKVEAAGEAILFAASNVSVIAAHDFEVKLKPAEE